MPLRIGRTPCGYGEQPRSNDFTQIGLRTACGVRRRTTFSGTFRSTGTMSIMGAFGDGGHKRFASGTALFRGVAFVAVGLVCGVTVNAASREATLFVITENRGLTAARTRSPCWKANSPATRVPRIHRSEYFRHVPIEVSPSNEPYRWRKRRSRENLPKNPDLATNSLRRRVFRGAFPQREATGAAVRSMTRRSRRLESQCRP